MSDAILTVPQAAKRLQISKSKLYGLLQMGRIPHIRLGRNVRIRESDLDTWLEKMLITRPPVYNRRMEHNGHQIPREDEIAAIFGLPRDRIDYFITEFDLSLDEGKFMKWFVENAEMVLNEKIANYQDKVGKLKFQPTPLKQTP